MEIERFEPHGSDPPVDLNYDANLLDTILIDKFNSNEFNHKIHFKYFRPKDYLPKIGFQIKEINELQNDYIGDPNGFCALWCIWWADLRLSNPTISRQNLVKLLFKELIHGKYLFKKIIRDYSFYVTESRDKMLSKANININEWVNDNTTDCNIKLLNMELINIIDNLD